MSDHLHSPINCLNWAPAFIPMTTSAIMCDGKVDTLPNFMFVYRKVMITEVQDPVIARMVENLRVSI